MSILTAYDKFIQQALKYGFSLFGLPKTGQTTSYRDGDDGDFEKGYPKAPPRFKDNGDGTVTDNATGLMWVKDPSQLGGVWGTPGNPSDMDWFDAIDNSEALDYAGHSDWRLPNIVELGSIVNWSQTNPATYPTYFPNTQNLYWSSTTFAGQSLWALLITFNEGVSQRMDKRTDVLFSRPVRLGVPKD